MVEKITKTEEEWREQLTEEEFHVTRQHGTERAFTGEYDQCKDPGVYKCRCCGHPLFDADHKFDSGTGWPSFYQPLNNDSVATKSDWSMLMKRTEVLVAVRRSQKGKLCHAGAGAEHLSVYESYDAL